MIEILPTLLFCWIVWGIFSGGVPMLSKPPKNEPSCYCGKVTSGYMGMGEKRSCLECNSTLSREKYALTDEYYIKLYIATPPEEESIWKCLENKCYPYGHEWHDLFGINLNEIEQGVINDKTILKCSGCKMIILHKYGYYGNVCLESIDFKDPLHKMQYSFLLDEDRIFTYEEIRNI